MSFSVSTSGDSSLIFSSKTPGDYVDEPDEDYKSEADSARLRPVKVIHGKDQGRADAAGAYKAEYRGLPDVDVKTVQDGRGERRRELRQQRAAEPRHRRGAHCCKGAVRPQIQTIYGLNKTLGLTTDAAYGHGQNSGKGSRPRYPHKDQPVYQKRDRAYYHNYYPKYN